MHEENQVVCVTPAGRRRYMRLLVPQVLSSRHVDRYDLWVNTAAAGDLVFLEGLARLDPRVRLVPHPDGAPPSTEAIGAFSRLAVEPDTIYVRLDDDVVWLEPGFFERLLAFRAARPEFFLVMPLILNNALGSNLLQTFGKIEVSKRIGTACMDPVGWHDPEFALALHRFALEVIARGEIHRLHCGSVPIALNRFSINCVSWFGRDMALAGGVAGHDEEEELSAAIPARLRRSNCFFTDVVAAHFAFVTQRALLDASGLLADYERLLAARPELPGALDRLRALENEADRHDDGSEFGIPSERPRKKFRLRHLLRRKKPRPPVTLRPGPNF